MTAPARRRAPRGLTPIALIPFVLAALLLHVVGLGVAAVILPHAAIAPKPAPDVVELVQLSPSSLEFDAPADEEEVVEEEEEPEPEEEPEDLDGQIVEIAPPEEKVKPEEADYLAEFDNTVDEETQSTKFEINPEVLAKQHSDEQKVEIKGENVMDLDMPEPSTGATVGNDRFDPDKHGTLAALPGQWQVTNKDGLEAPTMSTTETSTLSGSPQNDLLHEKRGTETNLNTKEFLYASYLLRIRRLVNFYWNQNLDNLPASVRLAKPEYTTSVKAILDGNGALESVEVAVSSGSVELDDCVTRAFRVAGPFPNPPEGLVEKDGRVYLPDMGFTVKLGVAEMKYDGIDPRAGVQFPGILKAPR